MAGKESKTDDSYTMISLPKVHIVLPFICSTGYVNRTSLGDEFTTLGLKHTRTDDCTWQGTRIKFHKSVYDDRAYLAGRVKFTLAALLTISVSNEMASKMRFSNPICRTYNVHVLVMFTHDDGDTNNCNTKLTFSSLSVDTIEKLGNGV